MKNFQGRSASQSRLADAGPEDETAAPSSEEPRVGEASDQVVAEAVQSPPPDGRGTPKPKAKMAARARGSSDSGRSSKAVALDVPPTPAGDLAAKLLAANRFQVIEQLREPLMMIRVGAVGEPSLLTEESFSTLETAARGALAAAAVVPRGLSAALNEEMAGLCRIGGRLFQLSALLRREQVVSAEERVQLRTKVADVAGDVSSRIMRMQAGLPGELEDFEACRRQLGEQAALALEAFALVQRWLDAERRDAAYSALGGKIGDGKLARPPRIHELDVTDMTLRVARKVLALKAGDSFDEALEAMGREIDRLAPAVVACASALDEAPLVRCCNSLDALAVFTRSAPVPGTSKVGAQPSTAAKS
jgi:hypothetical protein